MARTTQNKKNIYILFIKKRGSVQETVLILAFLFGDASVRNYRLQLAFTSKPLKILRVSFNE